jgi:hypothetical protein
MTRIGWTVGGLLVLVFASVALATHSRFSDVTDQHPVDAIEWAADLGITQGCDIDRFCPDQPLKRKHARVFMERFYDLVLGAGGDDQYANPDFTRADMMALLHDMTTNAPPGGTDTDPSITPTAPARGARVADHYWSADGKSYFVVLENVPPLNSGQSYRFCSVYMTQDGRRTGDSDRNHAYSDRMTVRIWVEYPANGFEVEC